MDDRGATGPIDEGGRPVASLSAAGLLVLFILGFVGMLAFGRNLLAVQVAPNVSAYLVVLVGLTLAIWLLSLAYVTRIGVLERRRNGGAA